VGEIEQALPNILRLTNQIATVLSNGASLTANLNAVALDTRPAISNITAITARLNERGALGEWLLPTNIHRHSKTPSALPMPPWPCRHQTSPPGREPRPLLDNLANLTSNLNS